MMDVPAVEEGEKIRRRWGKEEIASSSKAQNLQVIDFCLFFLSGEHPLFSYHVTSKVFTYSTPLSCLAQYQHRRTKNLESASPIKVCPRQRCTY